MIWRFLGIFLTNYSQTRDEWIVLYVYVVRDVLLLYFNLCFNGACGFNVYLRVKHVRNNISYKWRILWYGNQKNNIFIRRKIWNYVCLLGKWSCLGYLKWAKSTPMYLLHIYLIREAKKQTYWGPREARGLPLDHPDVRYAQPFLIVREKCNIVNCSRVPKQIFEMLINFLISNWRNINFVQNNGSVKISTRLM